MSSSDEPAQLRSISVHPAQPNMKPDPKDWTAASARRATTRGRPRFSPVQRASASHSHPAALRKTRATKRGGGVPFLPATRTPATLAFFLGNAAARNIKTHIDRLARSFVVHAIHGSSSPRHRGARGPRRGLLPPVLRRGARRRRADDDGPRRGTAAAGGGAVRRNAGAVRGGERGGAGGGRRRRRAPAAGAGGATADQPVHQLVQVAHLHRRPAAAESSVTRQRGVISNGLGALGRRIGERAGSWATFMQSRRGRAAVQGCRG